jgi:hypothetical protein
MIQRVTWLSKTVPTLQISNTQNSTLKIKQYNTVKQTVHTENNFQLYTDANSTKQEKTKEDWKLKLFFHLGSAILIILVSNDDPFSVLRHTSNNS